MEQGIRQAHWFAIADRENRGARSQKVPGQDWNNFRKHGEVSPHWRLESLKTVGHLNIRDGHTHTRHLTNPAEHFKGSGSGSEWFDRNLCVLPSQSMKRRAASAEIAKIPYPLAQWIARCFKPADPHTELLGQGPGTTLPEEEKRRP